MAACGSSDSPSIFENPTPDAGGGGGGGNGDGGTGLFDDGGGLHLSDAGPGSDIPAANIQSLQFTPNTWSVTSDGKTPKSQTFTLTATLKSDGSTVNVNADSLAFNRPDLATLVGGNPATLTVAGAIAGTGTLQAVYSGLTATATVTVAVVLTSSSGTISSTAMGALDGVTGGAGSGADGGTGTGNDGGTGSGTGDGGTGDGGAGGDGGTPTPVPGTPVYGVTDPTLKSILYPYDKTVFPLGVDSPLVMWEIPTSADVYKLHVTEVGYTFDYYISAAAAGIGTKTTDAQVQLPQDVWDELTASNQGDEVVFTLARYDGTTAWVSAAETWPIAHDSLRGSIYYWAISGSSTPDGDGEGHLARIHPGTGATPEYVANGQCIGCHAVSSDGTTLVGSTDGMVADQMGNIVNSQMSDPAPGDQDVIDNGRAWSVYKNTSTDPTALPTEVFQSYKFGGNIAVNNDGKYIVYGDQEMHLATTADGKLVAGSNLETLSYSATAQSGWMDPAFSPDGSKLAAIQGSTDSTYYPGTECTSLKQPFSCAFYINDYYQNLAAGPQPTDVGASIVVTDFSNGAFSPLRTLVAEVKVPLNGPVPGTPYFSYPTFAPDNATIAFQEADSPDGCHDGADCGPGTKENGAVYLTKDGTTTAVRLANLSDPPATADRNLTFEPTFNPNERGGYFWVVVSSSRAWGNKLPGGNTNINKRLWVAAIDTNGGVDPSHPAFFLQSQEQSYENKGAYPSINMRAFWSLSSCTASVTTGGAGTDAGTSTSAACTAGFECCSGFCEQGMCVDAGSVSCASVGDACTSDSQCCSSGATECSAGVCAPIVVR